MSPQLACSSTLPPAAAGACRRQGLTPTSCSTGTSSSGRSSGTRPEQAARWWRSPLCSSPPFVGRPAAATDVRTFAKKGGGGGAGGGGKLRRPTKGGKGHRNRPGDPPEVELQPLKTSFPTSLDWPEFTYERFQLGGIVGQGSYGDVFEGFDVHRKREVAVKRMTKFRDSNSVEKTLFKLNREVSLLRLLQDCPYTIKLYDALEDDYSVYIATELCTGGDLEGLLQEKDRLSEAEAACCFKPVLEFLKACHDHGVCFGDVKPSNFMLMDGQCPNGGINLKAIDFGCSQRIQEGIPLQIRMGTPIYFAPEVFKKWYGVEADCWSAGVMLYLMLSGSFPFWANDELATLTPQDVMNRVMKDEVEYLPDPWDSLSEEANQLVRGLLCKDKFDRLTAAEALSHPWFKLFSGEDDTARVLNNIVSKTSSDLGAGPGDVLIEPGMDTGGAN